MKASHNSDDLSSAAATIALDKSKLTPCSLIQSMEEENELKTELTPCRKLTKELTLGHVGVFDI